MTNILSSLRKRIFCHRASASGGMQVLRRVCRVGHYRNSFTEDLATKTFKKQQHASPDSFLCHLLIFVEPPLSFTIFGEINQSEVCACPLRSFLSLGTYPLKCFPVVVRPLLNAIFWDFFSGRECGRFVFRLLHVLQTTITKLPST